jgi:hypothetical protein
MKKTKCYPYVTPMLPLNVTPLYSMISIMLLLLPLNYIKRLNGVEFVCCSTDRSFSKGGLKTHLLAVTAVTFYDTLSIKF